MTWAILASGPSMNQQTADFVRNKCKVAVISDTYKLAPWADILVSNDRKWWEFHQEAFDFKGRKFCSQELRGVEQFRDHVHVGRNSGLMAMCIARFLGAKRLLLCGFDMHGSHFFGAHPISKRSILNCDFFLNHGKSLYIIILSANVKVFMPERYP